ncbi:hypothetical protein SAMN05660350_02145 [Geodermatophilus obscurus]|uniref:Uncharacterized protein n=1 Tax=Geodermatophilus obscurus TaxID=1861 RepID=A0A1M7TSJ8_9ACTN|nr:hypothetical protein [Geodermatophilus obscurus]SHN73648.1 hypothetical protein SAMN05660350_02145 [Geodermatophilus obscurus]
MAPFDLRRLRSGEPEWLFAAMGAVPFTLIGAFTTWFGITDLLTAPRVQAQVLGAVFAVAGLTLLGAAACLAVRTWRRTAARASAVLAGVAGFLVGAYLFLMQIRAPQRLDVPKASLWAAIAVASVGACLSAWHGTRSTAARQAEVGPLVKPLVSGVSVLALLGGGLQWWYEQQYLPGEVGATLTIQTEIEEQVRPAEAIPEGQLPDGLAYPRVFAAEYRIKNPSETRVQILASIYSVVRLPVEPRDPPAPEATTEELSMDSACWYEQLSPVQDPECTSSPEALWVRQYKEFHNDDVQAQDDWAISRYRQFALGERAEVLELGKAVPDGTYLEPEEEYASSFLVYVPNAKELNEDQLELRVGLSVAKGERLILDEETHRPEQVAHARESVGESQDRADTRRPRGFPDRYEVTEWRVGSQGAISELTLGTQSVNVIRVLSERYREQVFEYPYLVVCLSGSDRLAGTDEDDVIRQDPTVVCPGVWYEPDEEPHRGMAEYGRRMADYYGVTGVQATRMVSLLPPEEPSAGAVDQAPVSTRAIALPPEPGVVSACTEVFARADETLQYAANVESALAEHTAVMDRLVDGELSVDEAMREGLPSLVRGARESGSYAQELQDYQAVKDECGGSAAQLAPTRNAPCLDRVPEIDRTLTHAQAIVNALAEHTQVMDDLHEGRIQPGEAVARGRASLETGRRESPQFDANRAQYDGMKASCA